MVIKKKKLTTIYGAKLLTNICIEFCGGGGRIKDSGKKFERAELI